MPINSDFDLSERSKNPKPEKQELPKALNFPKIGILGPVPSETLYQKKMTKPLGILSIPNPAKKETDLTINSNNMIIKVQPIKRSVKCSDRTPPGWGLEGKKRLNNPRIDTSVMIGLKSKTTGGQYARKENPGPFKVTSFDDQEIGNLNTILREDSNPLKSIAENRINMEIESRNIVREVFEEYEKTPSEIPHDKEDFYSPIDQKGFAHTDLDRAFTGSKEESQKRSPTKRKRWDSRSRIKRTEIVDKSMKRVWGKRPWL